MNRYARVAVTFGAVAIAYLMGGYIAKHVAGDQVPKEGVIDAGVARDTGYWSIQLRRGVAYPDNALVGFAISACSTRSPGEDRECQLRFISKFDSATQTAEVWPPWGPVLNPVTTTYTVYFFSE